MENGELQGRVRVAHANLVLENVKTNVIATLVTATIVLIMLTQQLPKPFLLPWYAFFVVVTVVRYYHAHRCEKTPITSANVNRTLLILGLPILISGCTWGALGVVYVNADQPLISVILLMIFTGLVANASATIAMLFPLYLCFVVPILVPTAIKFYTLGETRYDWITALIFLYLVVSFITTSRIRASMRQSVLLRFENLDLIDDLKVENKKTEIALEKAEQANLAKSRFFAAASHDLRQPLQSLSMFTTTLATETTDYSQKTIVSDIDKSVRSLEGLFNALLDISTLDAGTMKLHQQHFQLKPLMEALLVELVELTQEKHLTLDVDVSDAVVFTDPLLLSRIVRNLVDNAVRYTENGGISISTEKLDGRLALSIVDTGIGLPEQNRSKIFEEFVQLNNPGRDRSKGLGLGLSIVNRICRLLNMPLSIQSEVGRGSTFTVAIELGDLAQVEQHEFVTAELNASLDGMFVLVIDDEEDIRLSMEGLLGAWGCTVMVASSGDEAVEQLKEYGTLPDAVISDYRLQGNETGGEALQLVREYCQRELPGIIVTGDIAPERLLEIDKLNVPVLHKPCDAGELRQHLQSMFSNSA